MAQATGSLLPTGETWPGFWCPCLWPRHSLSCCKHLGERVGTGGALCTSLPLRFLKDSTESALSTNLTAYSRKAENMGQCICGHPDSQLRFFIFFRLIYFT